MTSHIFVVTGPPGSGKTTLSARLARSQKMGMHLPVDDLREWVVAGRSDPTDWNDETERQFQLAESAAANVALTYAEGGCSVVIDHCRNLPRLDAWITQELAGAEVVKILVLTDLDETLRRNRERTNKDFDPTILDEIIRHTHVCYTADLASSTGWIVLDGGNADLSRWS